MKQKVLLKIFNIFFILFLSSCMTSPSENKAVQKSHLIHQLAKASIRQCKYRTALKQLQEALKLQSQNPDFYHSLALVYFQLREYKQAVHWLKEALKLKPEWTQAKVDLGRSLLEVQKHQEGLKWLQMALKDLTYPYQAHIHGHIGLALFRQKKFKEAEVHFGVSRKILTQSCDLSLYHARSLYALNQPHRALTLLTLSKRWCQKNLPLCTLPRFEEYFWSAVVYDKLKQRAKALSDLRFFLNRADREHPSYQKAKTLMKQWKSQKRLP